MIIQNIKFRREKVIISVGFFRAEELRQLLTIPKSCDESCHIEVYDPQQKIFDVYKKVAEDYPNIKPFKKAVGGRKGKAILALRTTKSTLCLKDFSSSQRCEEVEVVSLASILRRHRKIDKLLINCEGSEIPIISQTPRKLFKRCEFIFVQFHNFIPELKITKRQVGNCIQKLSYDFRVFVRAKKYSKYEFRRRI